MIRAGTAESDLDGDTRADALLSRGGAVQDPPLTCTDAPWPARQDSDRREYVVALHRVDGWHGWLLDSGPHPDHGTEGWIVPLRSGDVTYFGLDRRMVRQYGNPNPRPPYRTRTLSLWTVPPGGAPIQVFRGSSPEATLLVPLDRGDLLELDRAGQARLFRWNPRTMRLVPSAWQRRLPLARLDRLRSMPVSPGPCVTRMPTSFRLREQHPDDDGAQLPAGVVVELLATAESRSGARFHRVRTRHGDQGYVAVPPASVPAACAGLPRDP